MMTIWEMVLMGFLATYLPGFALNPWRLQLAVGAVIASLIVATGLIVEGGF